MKEELPTGSLRSSVSGVISLATLVVGCALGLTSCAGVPGLSVRKRTSRSVVKLNDLSRLTG